jgi:hypothetical protein
MKLPSWRTAQLAGNRRPRRSANAAAVLAKLQGGAVLYSGRVGDGRWWMLSGGTTLTGNTAKAVIANPCVMDSGDALFPGVRGQTFRIIPERS